MFAYTGKWAGDRIGIVRKDISDLGNGSWEDVSAGMKEAILDELKDGRAFLVEVGSDGHEASEGRTG